MAICNLVSEALAQSERCCLKQGVGAARTGGSCGGGGDGGFGQDSDAGGEDGDEGWCGDGNGECIGENLRGEAEGCAPLRRSNDRLPRSRSAPPAESVMPKALHTVTAFE